MNELLNKLARPPVGDYSILHIYFLSTDNSQSLSPKSPDLRFATVDKAQVESERGAVSKIAVRALGSTRLFPQT